MTSMTSLFRTSSRMTTRHTKRKNQTAACTHRRHRVDLWCQQFFSERTPSMVSTSHSTIGEDYSRNSLHSSCQHQQLIANNCCGEFGFSIIKWQDSKRSSVLSRAAESLSPIKHLLENIFSFIISANGSCVRSAAHFIIRLNQDSTIISKAFILGR